MWFGTNDGLNLMMGLKLKFSDEIPSKPLQHSKQPYPGNQSGQSGFQLWIGTFGNDLSYLDLVTEKLYSWQDYVQNNAEIDIGEKIFCIDINHENQQIVCWKRQRGILIIDLDEREMRF